MSRRTDRDLETILHLVRARLGTDFSKYRRPTVERRVLNRMNAIGMSSLGEYRAFLEGSPEETGRLVERLTIKVSSFYRNPSTFDLLRREIFPALAAERRRLRLWSAGSGRGEEAYTLAMLLEEAGVEGEVEATDLDEEAVEAAREGLYRPESTSSLPPELKNTHLEHVSVRGKPHVAATAALRRRVRFARGDLTSPHLAPLGAPFDLVLFRNVLIYLRPGAQGRTLSFVSRLISPGGYLCLGEAEWLVEDDDLFEVVNPTARVFRRLARERKESWS